MFTPGQVTRQVIILTISIYGSFGCSLDESLHSPGKEHVVSPLTGAAGTSWPCPDSTAIAPCSCTHDSSYNIDLDCSAALDEAQLAAVFGVVFPFDDVNALTIDHSVMAEANLVNLTHGVFDDKSLARITIEHTKLQVIEEGVFINSHNTLTDLHLNNNNLDTFPFDTLEQYRFLKVLYLNSNNIAILPKFKSDSITNINMNDNPNLFLEVGDQTFVETPNIAIVRLANIGLTDIPADLFKTLGHIREIFISSNDLYELEAGSINTPDGSNTIERLYLRDNNLHTVHVGAITGLKNDGELDVGSNQVQCLYEDAWKSIFDELSNNGIIMLDDNPLLCGCEIYWILQVQWYWDLISPDTTCPDNINIHALDKNFFDHNCQADMKIVNNTCTRQAVHLHY